ncbi:hypothetical protein [Paenibacillus roseipurpureus]|uniref:Uncharacterized protein n=1 Tax=Paenibacillus roseopurpureus TaxID=2918901 RepID=A0AA96LW32_9BACL|nr:hypothetical protein [Paenibacillus sp. MBLB1832]WNR45730.1 hypothetical protein MJB10_06415 [Paenibacillus sp. MBLB1832]
MGNLLHDVDFQNAMLFGHYVMVLIEGKMAGGGLVESFDETHVKVGRGTYSRQASSFVVSPPPQCNMDHTQE